MAIVMALTSANVPAEEDAPVKFVYSRASPAVRWPHIERFQEDSSAGLSNNRLEQQKQKQQQQQQVKRTWKPRLNLIHTLPPVIDPVKPRRMSRAALKQAKDWGERVKSLGDAICRLKEHEFVSDVVEHWREQMVPADYCYVLKRVGNFSWQRALEMYECLNVKRWYAPDPRMLAGVLSILGKANQGSIAQELFLRAEASLGDCVQVYNAMMSVYARHGDWHSAQELLLRMQDKGCQPDLVTFNIFIKARTRGGMQEGLASSLLQDVHKAGLRPDTVTYNTLISACSVNNRLNDAILIFEEMRRQGCEPDIWTFNAMISVYARARKVEAASMVFQAMQDEGFVPDAVTYNSILHAFAKAGRVDEVDRIRDMMQAAQCAPDEITYNTLIHMYGRAGLHQKAAELYMEMKEQGCHPDAITFTVLIDTFGKADLVHEAAAMFEDMLKSQVQPTLQAFSAMICAYGKAGMCDKAEQTFNEMLRSGISPDVLAYSVMLDLFYKAGLPEKSITIYNAMMDTGLKPELTIYCIMVRIFFAKGMDAEIEKLSSSMSKSRWDVTALASALANGGFYEEASVVLKFALSRGFAVRVETVEGVLSAFEASGKLEEARALLRAGSRSIRGYNRVALMFARSQQFTEAEEELKYARENGEAPMTDVYKALVTSYEQAGMHTQAVDKFLEMAILGLDLDADVLKSAITSFCEKALPSAAAELLEDSIHRCFEMVKSSDVDATVIETFGKLKHWRNARLVFDRLQAVGLANSSKLYKALLSAYANCGHYQLARQTLEAMASSGVETTAACANYVFEALGDSGPPSEVINFYGRLLELNITPDLKTFLAMFHSLTNHGGLEEAKMVYEDMKGWAVVPTAPIFKALLGLYCREGAVQDAENLVVEMIRAGFEPDLYLYNSMISMYSRDGSYKQAILVFKGMQEVGCMPDASTYNTLITLYSRNEMVQEAHSLLEIMSKAGVAPVVASYTTLISAYGRKQLYDEAEEVFHSMLGAGCMPDSTVYNVMINVYRKAGKHQNIEDIISRMKEEGFQPSLTTLHMLMDSYGKGGEPKKAAEFLENLPRLGINPDSIHYTSIIDGHLKAKDYLSAVTWLKKMRENGVELTHATITCFISGASLCERTSHALMLLKALADAGFSLPLRLLTEKTEVVLDYMDDILDQLDDSGPEAAQGVVNVIIDLLWAFRQCATAAHVFAAAIDKCIYSRVLARVRHQAWGADFRNLSPGAALVALILWLDQMQDASLQGVPEPSKAVYIVTGSSEQNNQASVSRTIKMHLYQMGSPFLPSRTRTGVLGAKGHALSLWLKESPYCMNLELRDTKFLPETSSIQIYNGAFTWAGLISAVQEIEEAMGEIPPKKFCRLVHLSPEGRAASIEADLKGRAEKLAKMLKKKLPQCSPKEEELKRYHKLRRMGKIKQQPKGQRSVPPGYERAGFPRARPLPKYHR